MRRSPPMKSVNTRTREYFLAAASPGLLTRPARDWALFALVAVMLGVVVFLSSVGWVFGLVAATAISAIALTLYQRFRRLAEECDQRVIAELKRGNASLSALIEQQLVAQTVSAFAHEVNQPLLAISAYSEAALNMLRRGVTDPTKLARTIEGAHTQALRAGALIHQMSTQLSRAICQSDSEERFDVNETIVQAVAEVFRHQRDMMPARLCLAPGQLWLAGSPARTYRIIESLLVNACEASRASGVSRRARPITVSSRRIDGFAEVGVQDFGSGVLAKDAERIFSPFYTTKQSGFGLGLSISRALAESQGGRLELSAAPGAGAEFFLTLPLAKTHEQDLPR